MIENKDELLNAEESVNTSSENDQTAEEQPPEKRSSKSL